MSDELTFGSICAGIGGFDLGFERAGWRSVWQIELDDVNREVLADRFPGALRFKDARDWRGYNLPRVKCVGFGSPCQGFSVMGNFARDKPGRGLADARSGIFLTCMEIVAHLQPEWLVFENVPGLFASHDGRDFAAVINAFAQRGYLGCWRVLDARYFGVPQGRRRLFVVAGLGRHPSMEFLADAGPVEGLPRTLGAAQARAGAGWAGYTLTSPNKLERQNSRLNLGSEVFVAEANGRDQMLERERAAELHGFRLGLDAANAEEAYGAGNAVCPAIAQWVAGILKRS